MKRDKLGRFIKGHNTPHSDETKRKISKTCKKKGIGKWMTGRKLSEETKAKVSKNNARYWLGKTGKEHAHWKEDKKNPLLPSVRQSFNYFEWRVSVFTRDNFTCVLCKRQKEVSGNLEADHYPKQFVEIFNEYKIRTFDEAINCKELWDINNGRTLCKECHNPTRGKQRYKVE